jgi:RimJ/RimL family protein N-acetyltransferase
MQMPTLETTRLSIRPLTREDELACHDLYVDIHSSRPDIGDAINRESRREWIDWTVRSYAQLSLLDQPPYGDRAIVSKQDGRFLGLVGLVPLLAPFAQLPMLGGRANSRFSPEVGLFWATSPAVQRNGYATEAARALIVFAFEQLRLARIVAGTEYANLPSIAVMRKLGMRIENNPFREPTWFQVVGLLESED